MLARVLLPSHDCTTCTPELQAQRGCHAPPPMPVRLDGRDLDRCPARPYKDGPALFEDALQAYGWWKRGMLPDPGTVLDQVEPYLATMAVLDAAIHDAQKARSERDRSAQDRSRDLQEKVRAAKAGKSAPRTGGRRFRPPPKGKGKR